MLTRIIGIVGWLLARIVAIAIASTSAARRMRAATLFTA
jgi:hypothetical protein